MKNYSVIYSILTEIQFDLKTIFRWNFNYLNQLRRNFVNQVIKVDPIRLKYFFLYCESFTRKEWKNFRLI